MFFIVLYIPFQPTSYIHYNHRCNLQYSYTRQLAMYLIVSISIMLSIFALHNISHIVPPPKRAGNLLPHAPKLRHNVGWVCGADMCAYLWLWRILDFLNALPTPQQLGNRTLPRAKAEPWMANLLRLRPSLTPSIRAFRKSYIRNPEQIRTHICTAYPSPLNAPFHPQKNCPQASCTS